MWNHFLLLMISLQLFWWHTLLQSTPVYSSLVQSSPVYSSLAPRNTYFCICFSFLAFTRMFLFPQNVEFLSSIISFAFWIIPFNILLIL